MDEGIVEGSKDTCNAEDKFACVQFLLDAGRPHNGSFSQLTFTDLRAERDVLVSGTIDLLLGSHFDRDSWTVKCCVFDLS
jgi:hypothetical protein